MAWCLPPELTSKFLGALKDGTITPEKMIDMTSAERHALFSDIVGEENAGPVNAALESKLLLKNQQAGLVTWAKKMGGLAEPAQRDIVSRIMRMDRLLNPAEERSFLADAAAQKLGAAVTIDEARQISQLAKSAQDAREAVGAEGWTPQNGTTYGRAVVDLKEYVNSLKPDKQSLANRLIDILNIPKSALTSVFHLSAPFVQGWGMLGTKQWYQGFGEMLRYFANEERYRDLNGYIIGHPDYPLAVDGGLGITNLGDRLSMREEALQSTLVQKASAFLSGKANEALESTGLPQFAPDLVRASSRAFTGFLNYVRFNRFTELLDAARNGGEDVSAGSSVVRDIAKAVNDFTGRGAIGVGDRYAGAAPALNALFFSPRKISATIEMFDPINYLDPRISPTARLAATRQLVGSVMATASVAGLAALAGAKVDWDPRSQGFMKIGIGDEKLDMTGGNAIFTRLLARLISNQEITSTGKTKQLGYNYAPTRADLVAQWMRGKLSPVASFFADALYGGDPIGRPFSLTQEARDKLLPITINSFYDYAHNDPKNYAAILPALSAIFGVSLQSPVHRDLGLGSGPAEDELSRLNFSEYDLPHPSGDPQFDKLVLDKLGPLVNTTLASFVQSPGYQRMGDPQRALSLQQVLRGLERAAKGQAIAADPQAYAKIRAAKVNPRLQAVIAPQPAEAE